MVLRAFHKVFQKLSYILIAFITSILIFLFAVWFPNIPLIVKIMNHPGLSLSERLQFPVSLLGSITTNFSIFSASYTIIIAILFGINLSMVIYLLRNRLKNIKKSGVTTSFLGLISGIIGMGCAACGTLLLTVILSLFGVSWIISFLPLAGGEFGILAIFLLGLSIYTTAKQIQNPIVCKI